MNVMIEKSKHIKLLQSVELETSKFVPLEISFHVLFHGRSILKEARASEAEASRYPILLLNLLQR